MLAIKGGFFLVLLMQIFQVCHSFSSFDMQNAEEVKESKRALMESLGLKYAPRTIPRQNDFLMRRYSAPKFMMGLFKEVTNEASNLNDTDEHYKIEKKYLDDKKVDTVISFFKYDHDKSWNRIHKEFKIKFKIHFDSQKEIVLGGELKIFKRHPRDRGMKDTNCSMSVYLIGSDGSTTQLIDKLDVRVWTTGWQTFNVTAAIKMWALSPQSNHGLKVVVSHAHTELSPRSIGLTGTRGCMEKRPYLVGFVTAARDFSSFALEDVPPSRERRATKEKWKTAGNTGNECKLKKFKVDFQEIGLDSNIIAPVSYNMFFCEGSCGKYPIDPSLKPTFHAELQALYHIVDSSAAPEPCCVPGTLKPLSLLFYNNYDDIVLKQHPDMVATSCSCR